MITNEEILLLINVLERNNELSKNEDKLLKKLSYMTELYDIKTRANQEIKNIDEKLSMLENSEETN